MGIEERRERERLERRSAILSAAGELFREKGYAATMDEIADRAELSKPTLYLYFRNKDDLYASIALEGFEALKENFRHVAASDAGAEVKVKAIYHAFVRFGMEHGQVGRITEFVMSETGRNRVSKDLAKKMARDVSDLLEYGAGAVREGIKSGVYAETTDPLAFSIIAWRSVLGLMSLAQEDGLMKDDPGFYQGLIDSALELLTAGITKR